MSWLDKLNGRPLDEHPHDILLWFSAGCLLAILVVTMLWR